MRKMRLIRCIQGKTLDDISKCVFLTKNYLRYFEKETYNLRIEHKQRIARMLGVTVEELCESLSEEEEKKYFNSNGSFKGFKAIQTKHKEDENKVFKKDIIKACNNQACPLNENCYCDNDVVKEGRGTCAGQNLVKSKPVSVVWSGTY